MGDLNLKVREMGRAEEENDEDAVEWVEEMWAWSGLLPRPEAEGGRRSLRCWRMRYVMDGAIVMYVCVSPWNVESIVYE